MKYCRFQIIVSLIIVSMLFPACQSLRYRVADNYYEQNAYSKAIPKYEQVLGKEFVPDAAEKVADCYRQTGNSLKAEFWYRKLVNQGEPTVQQKLALAECLMENGKYQEASRYFREYLLLNTTDNRVKRLALACDSVHWFFEDTLTYKISVPAFNKGFEANFSPQFYKEGIIFLSDRSAPGKSKIRSQYTGKEYLDIFFSRPIDADGRWLEPELLKGSVNGAYD
jgi:tetratricopeptide (TPR) repeat protein